MLLKILLVASLVLNIILGITVIGYREVVKGMVKGVFRSLQR